MTPLLGTLQQFIAPVVAAVLTLWAGWLAFAAESDLELPRMLAGQFPAEADDRPVSLARGLHIAHLALLVLAGTAAGGAVVWWAWPTVPGLTRLVVAVALVWVVGDLAPRVLAAIAPELTPGARRAAEGTLAPFRPLLRLVAWADRRAHPVRRTEAERAVGAAQRDMLLGVFSLADMTVAEVMTPRIDIVAVDRSATRDDVVQVLRRTEHARVLVYDGSSDDVAGVIYAKDMLPALGRDDGPPWQALIRPAAFVPEAKPLDRQLRDFQRGPSHLAVVVDEYGGTAGLLTLEDILEQIVGEIQDEYDVEEVEPILPLPDGGYRVQGGVPLAELEEVLEHDFEREDVSTVGGLVLAEFGRVPRWGEAVRVDDYEITVEQVARRRVRRISIRPLTAPEPETPVEEARP
ncbi:MAG TPA: hemolysin family protein [Gemmatimonadales bacterium]|nr:hemolysin family protein [Gemmatimonadales bacterium]